MGTRQDFGPPPRIRPRGRALATTMCNDSVYASGLAGHNAPERPFLDDNWRCPP